jgi:hypothetical protein
MLRGGRPASPAWARETRMAYAAGVTPATMSPRNQAKRYSANQRKGRNGRSQAGPLWCHRTRHLWHPMSAFLKPVAGKRSAPRARQPDGPVATASAAPHPVAARPRDSPRPCRSSWCAVCLSLASSVECSMTWSRWSRYLCTASSIGARRRVHQPHQGRSQAPHDRGDAILSYLVKRERQIVLPSRHGEDEANDTIRVAGGTDI